MLISQNVSFISVGKSTPPNNRQLIVLISNSEQ